MAVNFLSNTSKNTNYTGSVDNKTLFVNTNKVDQGNYQSFYADSVEISQEARMLFAEQPKVASIGNTFSGILDFIPGVSNIKSLIETFTGKDLITQRELSEFERTVVAAGILLPGPAKGLTKALGKKLAVQTVKNNEVILKNVQTFERARNIALDLTGLNGSNSNPIIGRLKTSAGYGKVIGRVSHDNKVRWRLDYDNEKGPHINVDDFRNGRGSNAIKIVIPFEGNENTYKSLLKHLQ